jgi:hypothetical protein
MTNQVTFHIEEIVGDITTYDVVLGYKGKKVKMFRDYETLKVAQESINHLKKRFGKELVRIFK